MQNYVDDEAEETLSFCDLQFCNDNEDALSGSQESSLENDQSSSSNSLSSSSVIDLELFEFFTGWSSTSAAFSFNTTSTTASDDINFRGKLNSPQKQSESEDPKYGFPRGKIPTKSTLNIFGGNLDTSFNRRSKTTPPRSNSSPPVPAKYSNIPKGNSRGKTAISSKRMAMLSPSSSTTKSWWFLFRFGSTSPSTVPKKMELSDLRSRWSRRNPSTMFCSVDEAVVAGGSHSENTARKDSFRCCGGL